MDDSDTLERPRFRKRSLLELVTNGGKPLADAPPAPASVPLAAEPLTAEFEPPAKKSDPLPKRGEPYRPYAQFLNRLGSEPHFLHFVHGDFVKDGFSYADLRRVILVDGDGPGQASKLVLRFVEAVVTVVIIEGRNLDDLHHYLCDKAVPWVWEQPKGLRLQNDIATVIVRISIEEVEC